MDGIWYGGHKYSHLIPGPHLKAQRLRPSKYQPYVFGGNTGLGFMWWLELLEALDASLPPCNQRLQQLQPP
jgi:hypothetical protein